MTKDQSHKYDSDESKKIIKNHVESNLPIFCEAVKKAAKENTFILTSQDAFASYMPTELSLLGMAVKYAGMHNVEIRIVISNNDVKYE